MLGTLAAPSLLGSCTGSESDKAAGISFAMNYFKVSEGDLRKVLAAALEKGGDYADLFFEHSYRNNVGLQDGAVNRASSNIDFGMGVRGERQLGRDAEGGSYGRTDRHRISEYRSYQLNGRKAYEQFL